MDLGNFFGLSITLSLGSSTARKDGTNAQAAVEIPRAKFVHPSKAVDFEEEQGYRNYRHLP